MMCKFHARSQKGFTLVELLVVIGIIGILALLLLPQFRGMRDRARIASCQSNLKNCGTQIEVDFTDRDDYPDAARFGVLTAAGPPAGPLVNLQRCSTGNLYTYVVNVGPPVAAPAEWTPAAGAAGPPVADYVLWCSLFHMGTLNGAVNFPQTEQLWVTQDGVARR